ncbi:MAG: TIGR03619 family F420-dependent LLM class oxidoreductase [Nitriliruptorales bacterium]|nr:TIGR03619 family F420-dependent LLM class oxidoreductase [Nitriliruptorales bacterium]
MKFGITFGQLHNAVWADAAIAADELGYESVWMPEHLVLPTTMEGELIPGEEHPPVNPATPVVDACAWLSWIAGQTERIRLGTFVYLLAIRHPFVGARAFATLDLVSNGRAEVGVGAGWLRTEWQAVGLDPRGRGKRLDEAIDLVRRLWTEERISADGPTWSFDEVMFEPKPVQSPPPIIVGGESQAALRRAATRGDGWIGMSHTPDSAAASVRQLEELRAEADRADEPFVVTVMGQVVDDGDVTAFADAGVDRLIVVPWASSRTALEDMQTFATRWIA